MIHKGKRQNGYIFKKGKSWYLRYSDLILREGKAVRAQLCKKLADYGGQYRTEGSVRPLADEILVPINARFQDDSSTMMVAEYLEGSYLPYIQKKRRPSTYKNYKDIFRLHLKPRLAEMEVTLRNFRTCDGERLLADIEDQAKLSESSLRSIKCFLSGGFKAAKRLSGFNGHNPMIDTSIGGTPARTTNLHSHVYSLAEVQSMLKILQEPAKTIVLFAAYTGLRKGEIAGVLWKDFDGKQLRVERSIWHGIVGKPKTKASVAVIPVAQPLQVALETHRKKLGIFADPELPIFQSTIHTPVDLANVANRLIKPAIEKCVHCKKGRAEHNPDSHPFKLDKSMPRWKGWHAFRRGLATALHQLGVPDIEIQALLRHESIDVTQNSYIKSDPESQVTAVSRVADAMAELKNSQSCNEAATLVN